MAFCDLCGKTLDEDELEELASGKQVCHDCRYDGLSLLREKLKHILNESRERLEQRREEEEERRREEAAAAETSDEQAQDTEDGEQEDVGDAPALDEDSPDEDEEESLSSESGTQASTSQDEK